jgi:hypothetical protein
MLTSSSYAPMHSFSITYFSSLSLSFRIISGNVIVFHIRWVPCHHGMACPQVADGEDALQFWGVAANILNKQSRTADKGWSSSLGVGRGESDSIVQRSWWKHAKVPGHNDRIFKARRVNCKFLDFLCSCIQGTWYSSRETSWLGFFFYYS